ncbi:MAG TPA: UV DNA damage repair endonuclease UvsE [Solirubrobacteraceae bacterium]|nr:UV DNA damage repair endonuclease UvsE [Solirubrobacteraceae bacterium]
MRLGFAVKVLGREGLPSHDTRRHRSEPSLGVSLERLGAILGYLDAIDVRLYRMATSLAPYASHPDLPRFRDAPRRFAAQLAEVGGRARSLGVRLTTHPGQYTVLNSVRPEVRALAAEELEVQAELMDGMGLGPESVVVLHVGGAAGGVGAALDRFEAGCERLSDAARARLAIENDDRSFGLGDVLRLGERTGRPIVFDVHHHRCHDPHGIPGREALALALATWPAAVTPKVHYATGRTGPADRAHADHVDASAFRRFADGAAGLRDFDVMLEAKAKDLALLRLRQQLAGQRSEPRRIR